MKNKLIQVKNSLRVTQDKAIALWRKACAAVTTLTAAAMTAVPASAADVKDSNIVKGTEKLIGDVTTWLMILAPVVAGMLIIYFCIRRSAADEMDQSAATCCC